MIQSQAQSSNRFRRPEGHPRRDRGVTLIYAIVMMSTLCAFTSLAVDYGRVQLCKVELRRAADAAARAGAGGLGTSPSAAQTLAIQYALLNTADGTAIVADPTQDIQLGSWVTDPTGKVASYFVALSGNAQLNANAVKVTLHRAASRGTALPLIFGQVIGSTSCDVSASSIAEYIPPVNVNQNVLATANPFLSGMPAGSVASEINPHNDIDHAGTSTNVEQSPAAVAMTITSGASLSFNSIDGTARHDPGMAYYEPDGETDNVGHNNLTTSESGDYASTFYSENGIADMNAPINALVGIFLDDNAPSSTATPASLDFSSDASRNFTTLQPQLKQLFFIGDGLTDGGTPQNFIAPKGATRLYLATWDFYEWSNNAGARNVQIIQPAKIITVQ